MTYHKPNPTGLSQKEMAEYNERIAIDYDFKMNQVIYKPLSFWEKFKQEPLDKFWIVCSISWPIGWYIGGFIFDNYIINLIK